MSKENPQLEDGYTRVANKLLEAIILSGRVCSKDEIRIALVVVRQTYGYSRKQAPISFSFFEKATKINRRNIQRAIAKLLDKGLINCRAGAKKKFGKPVYNYEINKKGYSQYDYSTVVNMTTEAVVNMTTNKEKKENFKERKKQLVDKFSMKVK